MGDRTTGQVIIYDCPLEHAGLVLDALNNEGFNPDWNHFTDNDKLVLGEVYGNPECYGDASETVAACLYETKVSFAAWTDPKYEWLGSLVWHTPDLGRFLADCDAEGQPCFTTGEIRAAMKHGGFTEHDLGTPWEDAFEALRKSRGGTVLIPQKCPDCMEWMRPWGESKGEPGMHWICDCGKTLFALTDGETASG